MEPTTSTPQQWEIQVAVQATAYAFDCLFSYVHSHPIVPGCRVVVPFGKGNGLRVGLVMACTPRSQPDPALKAVAQSVDEVPILSQEMLELVCWLREMTFCTYFDAVRAILPGGLQLQIQQSLELVEPVPDAPLPPSAENLLQILRQAESRAAYQKQVQSASADPAQKKQLVMLEKQGYLRRTHRVRERTHGQNHIKMLRLASDYDPGQYDLTPAQQKLAQVLSEDGALPEKEACYRGGVSAAVAKKLVEKGAAQAYAKPIPLYVAGMQQQTQSPKELQLSHEQQAAYQQVADALGQGMRCFLLYGVTGSGKTSVFIRLMDTVLEQGKQVILLVPEIALTPQTVARIYRYFGEKAAVYHSELSEGQRSETWRQVASGQIRILVGTRSAIFAPVQDLGLVIVDEEGERTYKSESAPRYHAISVAKKRCQTHGCPLLLASATPSIESFYLAKRGVYTLLELTQRYNQTPLPNVEVVDMQEERTLGNESMFSLPLMQALQENLDAGKQSLLLLNRRGYHTIISCASCNKPVYCPNCSVPMTYHKINDSLMCHYCGHVQALVTTCPACGSGHLRKMGFGTQKLEEQLAQFVPKARILRMDADTTMSRAAYEANFTAFRDHAYDIMLGTQMIGKGLDFPDVTLVGVMSVDKALYAGDFRSYERTFSLVTQVVGRGGRGDVPGRAILQTSMPDHYVLQLAAQQAYGEFYEQEIALRRQLIFPPICDICVIGFTGVRESLVCQASQRTAQILKDEIRTRQFSYPIWVLDPVPCAYGMINRKFRYQLVVKCKNTRPYRDLIRAVLEQIYADRTFAKVYIYADMNGDIGI